MLNPTKSSRNGTLLRPLLLLLLHPRLQFVQSFFVFSTKKIHVENKNSLRDRTTLLLRLHPHLQFVQSFSFSGRRRFMLKTKEGLRKGTDLMCCLEEIAGAGWTGRLQISGERNKDY
jgi:hypothetical protein